MDVVTLTSQLSKLANQAAQDIETKIVANNLNDPGEMLKAQFSVQQYGAFVGYTSALMKAIKDMNMSIISKI
jgi:type III secretion protein F